MNIKEPDPLHQHVANFLAGIFAMALASTILILPKLDQDTEAGGIAILATCIFTYFGWKASNSLVEKIKHNAFSDRRKKALIWSLSVLYIVVFSILNALVQGYHIF